MKLSDVMETLSLRTFTPVADPAIEINGGYCGDLLSHVLAAATPGDLWITIQHHANVVAVAQVAGISAVIIADGKEPGKAAVERARSGGITLLGTEESAFETSGRLHHALAVR